MSKKTIVLGSRGSALALWQAHHVRALLERSAPDFCYRIKTIRTTGDRILDAALSKIGDKGLFTKELETALLQGDVDMCIHSMKDMPTRLPEGLLIGGMPTRAKANEALIARAPHTTLHDLPAGSRVATGSLRRQAQIARMRPDLETCDIRGNVETRIRRVMEGDFDATILACAGVERLELQECITFRFPVDEMIPATGQGAIGIEIREGDEIARTLCQGISDRCTFEAVSAERIVLDELEGGCQIPIGVHAYHDRTHEGTDELHICAFVGSLDGTRHIRTETKGSPDHIRDLACSVVEDLLAQGASSILEEAGR